MTEQKTTYAVAIGDVMIRAIKGDITKIKAGAIVNAANPGLESGGGVCGAIFAAAGKGLDRECDFLVKNEGGHINPGQVAVSAAWNIKTAKYIIHAVGPVWNGGKEGEAGLLAAAYRESLLAAEDLRVHSIAFPAISTGIYGYPLEEATWIALKTIKKWAREGHKHPREIIFVTREDTDEVYCNLLTRLKNL